MDVKVNIMEAIKAMRDKDFIFQTDSRLKLLDTVEEYSAFSSILKQTFSGNLVVSDRVHIIFSTLQVLSSGSYSHIEFSIDTDKAQADDGAVLGYNEISVTLFEEKSENSCKVTNLYHFDPKGSVPAFLVNAFFKERHAQFVTLRGIIEKSCS